MGGGILKVGRAGNILHRRGGRGDFQEGGGWPGLLIAGRHSTEGAPYFVQFAKGGYHERMRNRLCAERTKAASAASPPTPSASSGQALAKKRRDGHLPDVYRRQDLRASQDCATSVPCFGCYQHTNQYVWNHNFLPVCMKIWRKKPYGHFEIVPECCSSVPILRSSKSADCCPNVITVIVEHNVLPRLLLGRSL